MLVHQVDYIFLQGIFKIKSWCAPCSTDNLAPHVGECGGPDIPSLPDAVSRVKLEYGGNWSAWERFSGPLNRPLNSEPGVSSWGLSNRWDVGQLDVFVKGNDDGLYLILSI